MQKINTIFLPFLLVPFLFSGLDCQARETGGEDTKLPIVLYLKETSVQSQLVDIGYEINYPGFVEFHLFNEEGKLLFLTSMVKPKGKHAMRLKKRKLPSDRSYRYYFIYKGKEYHGDFSL